MLLLRYAIFFHAITPITLASAMLMPLFDSMLR